MRGGMGDGRRETADRGRGAGRGLIGWLVGWLGWLQRVFFFSGAPLPSPLPSPEGRGGGEEGGE